MQKHQADTDARSKGLANKGPNTSGQTAAQSQTTSQTPQASQMDTESSQQQADGEKSQNKPNGGQNSGTKSEEQSQQGDQTMQQDASKAVDGQNNDGEASSPAPPPPPPQRKTALEYVEEIASVLKTAFPLLALSVELVCDQISARFKAVPDEDIFRLITALLQDAMQQYINRAPNPDDNGLLPKATTNNIMRFAQNLPHHLKDLFHQDFIASEPNLPQYVKRLQAWRDRYDRILDRKPKRHPLETLSHWLVEYKYQTFDEIEVPGQYFKVSSRGFSFIVHRAKHVRSSRITIATLSRLATLLRR